MFVTVLMMLGVVAGAALWVGFWIWGDRDRRHHGYPRATEGGSPTVYRRRPPPEADVPSSSPSSDTVM